MNRTAYVAFSTQKGGAGKTTLTVLVASYLHYVKGYKVAVIDCDYPQFSIENMRQRDKKATIEDAHYNRLAYEQMKRLGVKPYPVVPSKAGDALDTAERIKAKLPNLDYIFFDMPGTANNHDIVNTISKMDYIFTPIIADCVIMESSIVFAKSVKDLYISPGKGSVKAINLVWNMVDKRERTELYQFYDAVCAELALPIMKTSLPDSKRFRKETALERKAVFRSTMFPADRSLVKGSNLDELVNEFITITKP